MNRFTAALAGLSVTASLGTIAACDSTGQAAPRPTVTVTVGEVMPSIIYGATEACHGIKPARLYRPCIALAMVTDPPPRKLESGATIDDGDGLSMIEECRNDHDSGGLTVPEFEACIINAQRGSVS